MKSPIFSSTERKRVRVARVRTIVLSAVMAMAPVAIWSECPAHDTGTELKLIEQQRFDEPAQHPEEGQMVLTSEGWYITKQHKPDMADEGSCDAAVFDSSGKQLWSGGVGCTIYPAPKEGVFFSYNPTGDLQTEIYNIGVSDRPVVSAALFPTEHAFSLDGSLILFGGGVLTLYDATGKEYFTRDQRSQRDMTLGISPNGKYVTVADLLEGSALKPESDGHSLPDVEARGKEIMARQGDARRVRREAGDTAGAEPHTRPERDKSRRLSDPGHRPVEKQFATILTTAGDVTAEVSIPGFARAIGVSDDGGMIAVGCGAVITVLRSDGSKAWEYPFDEFYTYVKGISVDDEGRVTAVINESWKSGGSDARFLYTWNDRGELTGWAPLDDRRALDFYDVFVSRAGDTVVFRDDRVRSVYRVTPQ